MELTYPKIELPNTKEYTIRDGHTVGYVTEIMPTNKDPIKLQTVRIMGVSLAKYQENELLVVSLVDPKSQMLSKIRIYLKEDVWSEKTLAIATEFYNRLVKYRELLRKKVSDKHLYNSYREIQDLEGTDEVPLRGVCQLYIKPLKSPKLVLSKPRKGYKEVKSDTKRLWIRDELIRIEKEKYENIKGEN